MSVGLAGLNEDVNNLRREIVIPQISHSEGREEKI